MDRKVYYIVKTKFTVILALDKSLSLAWDDSESDGYKTA